MSELNGIADLPVLKPGSATTTMAIGQIASIGSDPTRLVVLITCGTTGAALTVEVNVGSPTPLTFTVPLSGFVELTWQKHGPLCQYPIKVTSNANNTVFSYYFLRRS